MPNIRQRIIIDARDRSKAAFQSASSNAKQLDNNLAKVGNSIRLLSAGLATSFVFNGVNEIIGSLKESSDQAVLLTSRLKIMTESTQEYDEALKTLTATSLVSGSVLRDNATLYTRIIESVKRFGFESKDALDFTDALAKSLRISGVTTKETSSIITQMSQALGSGTLQGEELKAVLEASTFTASILAKGITEVNKSTGEFGEGVSIAVGDLKRLGKEGKLTTEVVLQAMISQLDVLTEKNAQIPLTIGQALTNFGTGYTLMLTKLQEGNSQLAGIVNGAANIMLNFGDEVIVGIKTALAALVLLGTSAIVNIIRKRKALAAQRELDALAAEREHQRQIIRDRQSEIALGKKLKDELLLRQAAVSKIELSLKQAQVDIGIARERAIESQRKRRDAINDQQATIRELSDSNKVKLAIIQEKIAEQELEITRRQASLANQESTNRSILLREKLAQNSAKNSTKEILSIERETQTRIQASIAEKKAIIEISLLRAKERVARRLDIANQAVGQQAQLAAQKRLQVARDEEFRQIALLREQNAVSDASRIASIEKRAILNKEASLAIIASEEKIEAIRAKNDAKLLTRKKSIEVAETKLAALKERFSKREITNTNLIEVAETKLAALRAKYDKSAVAGIELVNAAKNKQTLVQERLNAAIVKEGIAQDAVTGQAAIVAGNAMANAAKKQVGIFANLATAIGLSNSALKTGVTRATAFKLGISGITKVAGRLGSALLGLPGIALFFGAEWLSQFVNIEEGFTLLLQGMERVATETGAAIGSVIGLDFTASLDAMERKFAAQQDVLLAKRQAAAAGFATVEEFERAEIEKTSKAFEKARENMAKQDKAYVDKLRELQGLLSAYGDESISILDGQAQVAMDNIDMVTAYELEALYDLITNKEDFSALEMQMLFDNSEAKLAIQRDTLQQEILNTLDNYEQLALAASSNAEELERIEKDKNKAIKTLNNKIIENFKTSFKKIQEEIKKHRAKYKVYIDDIKSLEQGRSDFLKKLNEIDGNDSQSVLDRQEAITEAKRELSRIATLDAVRDADQIKQIRTDAIEKLREVALASAQAQQDQNLDNEQAIDNNIARLDAMDAAQRATDDAIEAARNLADTELETANDLQDALDQRAEGIALYQGLVEELDDVLLRQRNILIDIDIAPVMSELDRLQSKLDAVSRGVSVKSSIEGGGSDSDNQSSSSSSSSRSIGDEVGASTLQRSYGSLYSFDNNRAASENFITLNNDLQAPKRFSTGGALPGYGGGDVIPALLESGEFVIKKEAAAVLGGDVLNFLNNSDKTKPVKRSRGGYIDPSKLPPRSTSSSGDISDTPSWFIDFINKLSRSGGIKYNGYDLAQGITRQSYVKGDVSDNTLTPSSINRNEDRISSSEDRELQRAERAAAREAARVAREAEREQRRQEREAARAARDAEREAARVAREAEREQRRQERETGTTNTDNSREVDAQLESRWNTLIDRFQQNASFEAQSRVNALNGTNDAQGGALAVRFANYVRENNAAIEQVRSQAGTQNFNQLRAVIRLNNEIARLAGDSRSQDYNSQIRLEQLVARRDAALNNFDNQTSRISGYGSLSSINSARGGSINGEGGQGFFKQSEKIITVNFNLNGKQASGIFEDNDLTMQFIEDLKQNSEVQ